MHALRGQWRHSAAEPRVIWLWRMCLLCLLAVGSGFVVVGLLATPVAADAPAASTDRTQSTVSPTIDEESPIDNANGTTEVIVRFTPVDDPGDIGDPDDDGTAAVADLRDHAAAEQAAFDAFVTDHQGVSIEHEFWLANAMVVTVDAEVVDTADLLAVENVTRVHPNIKIGTLEATTAASETITPTTTPTTTTPTTTTSTATPAAAIDHRSQIDAEPSGAHTWGIELIEAPAAWDRFETRGEGASVAVIDTGVDPTHQDIDIVSWASFDGNGTLVSDDVAAATDPNGHGTHVAGTVAGGNGSGTAIGVAPDADIHGLNAFGADGTATFAGVLAAMEHATVESNADVLQMSLGASGTFRGFIRPVQNARATGTIVVAAAGNDGEHTSSAPGNIYDSLAVGAVDEQREVAAFSSGQRINATAAFATYPDHWPEHYVVPDVSAPGVRVVSAEAGTTDGYVRQQGTSMAAPHVSGIAALAVAATDGRITDADLQAAIIDSAVHPSGAAEPDDRYGHGVVDAPAAIDAAVEASPPPPEPTNESESDMNQSVDEAADTDASTPGFGVGAAVTALLVVMIGTAVARANDKDGG